MSTQTETVVRDDVPTFADFETLAVGEARTRYIELGTQAQKLLKSLGCSTRGKLKPLVSMRMARAWVAEGAQAGLDLGDKAPPLEILDGLVTRVHAADMWHSALISRQCRNSKRMMEILDIISNVALEIEVLRTDPDFF